MPTKIAKLNLTKEYHETSRASRVLSMGLKSGENLNSPYTQTSHSCRLSQVYGDLLYHPLKRKQDHCYGVQSHRAIQTSSRYWYGYSLQTAFKDAQVDAISQRNPCLHHDTSTQECMIFVGGLEPTASAFFFPDLTRQTLTHP